MKKPDLPISKKVLAPKELTARYKEILTGVILHSSDRAPSFVSTQHLKTEKINKYTRLYGVELEVERRANTPDTIVKDIYTAMPGRVIIKRDGSLSNGFEIVSAPATLEAHRAMWVPFFIGADDKDDKKKAPAAHLKAFDTSTCGMHVHIARASMSPILLYNFWRFFNQWDHDEYIARIAGRQGNSYSRAVKDRTFFETMTSPQSRYHHINVSNQHTIEVRIFRGNTDYIGFFKNLDFLDSLLVLLETQPRSTGADYIKYVIEQKDRWPYMFQWLRRHKVELTEAIPKALPKAMTVVRPEISFKFPGE